MPEALFTDLEVRSRAWAIAVAMMGNVDDAEDVLQDALLVAFDKAPAIAQRERSRWFAGVVRNVARNHIRRRNTRAMSELSPIRAAPQREHLDPADARQLLSALQDIPVDEREAVVLCHMQGFSLDEAAALLEVNRNTLKSRVQRGITYLREKLRVSAPGLEAYLATVAIPCPRGGFDAAVMRWARGSVPAAAGVSLATLIAVCAVAAIGAAVTWVLLPASSVGDGGQNPSAATREAGSSGQRASMMPVSEATPAVTNARKAPQPTPGDATNSSDATADSKRQTSGDADSASKPQGQGASGAYRTRATHYANGVTEAQWVELERSPGVFVLEGNFVAFYPSGVLREVGQFADNNRTGMWKSFHDNGALESISEYRDGLQEGMGERHSKEGILLERGPYVADQFHGEWRIFYPDTGTLREVVTFRKGRREGVGTTYDKQGNVAAETQWLAGKRHGVERVYGPAGMEERLYEHGVRVR